MTRHTVMVIGAGAWGTALASVFARVGNRTLIWDRNQSVLEHMEKNRRHPTIFPDVLLHEHISICIDMNVTPALDCAVFVVPFQKFRLALKQFRDSGIAAKGIVCASKGLELGTGSLAHQIVIDELGVETPFSQISGPNFASEVINHCPAAISVASSNRILRESLVNMMYSSRFRPYLTEDVIGVELGGALKNVIAIAAGISDGLRLGSNARAALMTRGLGEIARLGEALGASRNTFMGLSGLGDLVLTCTDDQSRNRRFGLALARLGAADLAESEVGALVEGVASAKAVTEMAARLDISVPISSEIWAVISGVKSVQAALETLLTRVPVTEGN
jgi:glycerol-3-phosphate dehydrogenase (NAD(P)+)